MVREITAYWCVRRGGGVGSAAAGSSGIGGPHLAGGSDSRDAETAGGAAPGAEVESAAAARRRAERALAEQRRADLELLEARRQQRKLNFLLTQTELYSHFMTKTMSGGTAGGDGRVESILERLQEVPKASDETGNTESTLAEAAKAAAGRLGINVDDEFGRGLRFSPTYMPLYFALLSVVSFRCGSIESASFVTCSDSD